MRELNIPMPYTVLIAHCRYCGARVLLLVQNNKPSHLTEFECRRQTHICLMRGGASAAGVGFVEEYHMQKESHEDPGNTLKGRGCL